MVLGIILNSIFFLGSVIGAMMIMISRRDDRPKQYHGLMLIIGSNILSQVYDIAEGFVMGQLVTVTINVVFLVLIIIGSVLITSSNTDDSAQGKKRQMLGLTIIVGTMVALLAYNLVNPIM